MDRANDQMGVTLSETIKTKIHSFKGQIPAKEREFVTNQT